MLRSAGDDIQFSRLQFVRDLCEEAAAAAGGGGGLTQRQVEASPEDSRRRRDKNFIRT